MDSNESVVQKQKNCDIFGRSFLKLCAGAIDSTANELQRKISSPVIYSQEDLITKENHSCEIFTTENIIRPTRNIKNIIKTRIYQRERESNFEE